MTAEQKTRWKRPQSVLVLVATRDGQVLLIERLKPRGFWQSVTGSLEWGELPLAAARRELQEETGLDGAQLLDLKRGARFAIRPPWRERYRPGVRFNREHWFVLLLDRRPQVRLNPAEHVRYKWLPAARAAHRASSWTNRRLIRQVFGL